MTEQSNTPWDKIGLLLHIVEKSAGHPQLGNIKLAALNELAYHNSKVVPNDPHHGDK